MRPNYNDWYPRHSYHPDVNISQTKKNKNKAAQTNRGNIDTSTTATRYNNIAEQESHQVCIGCGSHQHNTPGTSARHLTCPAWGQTCNYCGKCSHFSTVCQTKKEHHWAVIKSFKNEEAPMNTLIAHIIFDQIRATFMFTDGDQVMEINASIIHSHLNWIPDGLWISLVIVVLHPDVSYV